MKKSKEIKVILIAANGFTQTIKMLEKDLTPRIKIPFMYRLRVSDPVVGDYTDLESTPVGEFMFKRRTKTTAWYELYNMYQAKEIK